MPFIPRPAAPSLEIIVTSGQSNMSGAGALSELPTFARANRVWTFRNNWTWRCPSFEPVDDPEGQIDTVSLDTPGWASNNMAFADELARLRPGKQIGLVPCAKGGSSITAWQRSTSRSTLYGSMLARALKAAEAGAISGLVHNNGEEDARTLANATGYADMFLQMVSDFRADIGIPNLPVICTEIGPTTQIAERPYWPTVQEQQRGLDGMEGIKVVSAVGLVQFDGVHLNTMSQCALGRKYAHAMASMLTG